MLAFSLQALVSLVLSLAAKFLEEPDFLWKSPGPLHKDTIDCVRRAFGEANWKEPFTVVATNIARKIKEEIKTTILPKHLHTQGRSTNQAVNRIDHLAAKISTHVSNPFAMLLFEGFRSYLHNIGDTVEVADRILRAFTEHEIHEDTFLQAIAETPSTESANYRKKQELICNILLMVSDAQTMTGEEDRSLHYNSITWTDIIQESP